MPQVEYLDKINVEEGASTKYLYYGKIYQNTSR